MGGGDSYDQQPKSGGGMSGGTRGGDSYGGQQQSGGGGMGGSMGGDKSYDNQQQQSGGDMGVNSYDQQQGGNMSGGEFGCNFPSTPCARWISIGHQLTRVRFKVKVALAETRTKTKTRTTTRSAPPKDLLMNLFIAESHSGESVSKLKNGNHEICYANGSTMQMR